ncbi:MAG: FAD-binding protein [Chloroflexi bacterium]|nr:FAD-binding protein [Chloroflexota bacterium]
MNNWDMETEVLVIGYGLAGAVAAVVAHDAGSQVLMLEKGKYPGGCSILAGGGIKCVADVPGAIDYFTALSGGRVEPSLITAFAEAMSGNEAFVRRLAATDGAEIKAVYKVGDEPIAVYPFLGRESLYEVRVTKVPGFSGFPWVIASRLNGVNMFKMAMDNVEARKLPLMLSTAATRLVTNAQGEVIGAVAQSQEGERRIRARRSVILACGGFEQSPWLKHQYLQGTPFHSMAPLTHTGDGILMAQKVGAALWHMWHVHGSYGFKFPQYPIAFRHAFGGRRLAKRPMPWIVVDRLGKRYMNEYPPAPQDTSHRPMEVFDPDLPGYPRIPSYIVFDEAGRRRGPIAQPLAIADYLYRWSNDNSQEVERGWIIRRDNLTELAEVIRTTPENEGKMNPQNLEDTVARWNEAVVVGMDALGRLPGTMMPIKAPPFYAVPVWPVITNTQGGPVHNEKQQVLDPLGQPIPHLYAAGELGSFFGHLYELGGNLGECFASGRIAGEAVAAEELLP